MTIKVDINKRGRNEKEEKRIFESALRKFRNKTKPICKEVDRRRFFEKPCIENERVRRRHKKEKKYFKSLQKRYGRRWQDFIEH